MPAPDWYWNEFQQIGTDYTSTREIEDYDTRMASFRDVAGENAKILSTLSLPEGAAVLEIGCGTGRFARTAATAGLSVTAIDVSERMLEYVSRKSKEEGLPDIVTRHAGFLSMDFPQASFAAVVTSAALHHLPDAWKLVALRNIARVLAPGGFLFLKDVVFVLRNGDAPEQCLERFADSVTGMRKETARHVAKEFSTYDWILDGMLQQSGFAIISKTIVGESLIEYHCRNVCFRNSADKPGDCSSL